MAARLLITLLMLAASAALLAPFAAAQGSDTVHDEADALSAAEEQDVQAAFDRVSEESGEQLHAFVVSDTNVDPADRPEFLTEKAGEAGAPPAACSPRSWRSPEERFYCSAGAAGRGSWRSNAGSPSRSSPS